MHLTFHSHYRFTAEEKQARSPYQWLPFGYGPRNCIGMRLAVLEMKIAIASIAQKMKLVKCANTEVSLSFYHLQLYLSTKPGIK